MTKICIAATMGDALDWVAIHVAGIVPVEMDDMGVGSTGLISGHIETGDQCSRQHLFALVDVGHFTHDQEASPNLHEVALVAEPLQVGTTTERFG